MANGGVPSTVPPAPEDDDGPKADESAKVREAASTSGVEASIAQPMAATAENGGTEAEDFAKSLEAAISSGAEAKAAQPMAATFAAEQPPAADDERLLKEFFAEVKEVDRDNEVNRILGAFKLNPFEQLGLRFDATPEDAKRQYRKISLMVHPDKCKHPRATDAFEVLGNASKELAEEEKTRELLYLLNLAREDIRKERKKQTKNDAAVRLASVIHEAGRDGVEAAWESTDAFHEAWKMKSRDMLARAEWRRRKLTKRLVEEEERIEEDEAETRKRMKAQREHSKNWEETRETRVGTWRTFVNKKGKSKKGSTALGGVKPPKSKTADEEHTFIQRPVGEQFRPPPLKGPPPKVVKK